MIWSIAFATLINAAGSPEGNWSNPDGSVTVRIAACGNALCGHVIEASDQAKADARRGGTEQLIGTELMTGFEPAGEGRWEGRLFIPDMNRRQNVQLELLSADRMKVRGCMIGKVLCKSQVWTRAD